MIAEPLYHPNQIKVGDRIASYHTSQHVQKVTAVQTCDGKCRSCFAPTIHVQTNAGEVRFSVTGFTNGLPWSRIR